MLERLSALLLIALECAAQSTKVEIMGQLLSPDRKEVSSALISIANLETGFRQELESNTDGRFQALGLPPGNYRIEVNKQGFSTWRHDVKFSVGDRLELTVNLKLAEAGQVLEVFADSSVPRTMRGTVSFVLDQKKIISLPLDGRNFVPLIALSPGVTLPPGNVLPRINGSRPRVSEYIYDGISVLQPEPGQVAYYPVIDAIEEFRVETNSYSAEYGRSNGGVILVNQKSGTNQWHGTLFEFFRNEKLNARNFFATAGSKPMFRRNQYGFAAGGPIQKNKTFIFGDWQGTQQEIGTIRISTVPTESFSQLIYDPLTTRQTDRGFLRDAFPGNVLPLERLDPVAVAGVGRYPLPNLQGTVNNYRRVSTESISANQFDARLDRYFGSRRRLFGKYTFLRDSTLPAASLPGNDGLGMSLTRADSIAVEHSSSLNQLRFGFTRRSFVRSTLALPTYDIVGYELLGPVAGSNADFNTSVTQLIDSLNWVNGRHSIKVGLDIRWQKLNILQPPNPSGNYQFTSLFTANLMSSGSTVAGTGNAFASYMLGQVQRFSADAQPTMLSPRAVIAESFLQDDWRVSRKLTLNLGVRYTLNFPSTVKDDQTAVFDLNKQNLRFGGKSRSLEKFNFAPRLGMAFVLKPNVMIRAGYGLTWIEQAGITTPFTSPMFPFVQTIGQQSFDNIHPAFLLSQGPQVQPSPPNADSGLGQGVFGVQRDNGSGYAQQWNLSLQRTIGKNWNVEGGYLGSKLTRLGVPDVNLNQLTVEQLSQGSALTAQVSNPFFGQIPASSSLGGPTLPRAQLLRRFPRFTTVSLYRNNVGHSTYHSAQVRLEKRFSAGFTFTTAYTYSKLIDDAGAVFDSAVLTGPVLNFQAADSFNRRLEKDVSTGNVPHNFSAGFVYEWKLGFQVAGIVRRQSGSPIAVTQATNLNAFAGFGVQRPNRIADPLLAADSRSLSRWFDTAAFTQAPQFTIGNSSRNPVIGPRYSTIDLMVGKTWKIVEGLKLETRAEAFNLTNTPPLGNPNGSFGNAAFGTITQALDPRVFEFVMKVHF